MVADQWCQSLHISPHTKKSFAFLYRNPKMEKEHATKIVLKYYTLLLLPFLGVTMCYYLLALAASIFQDHQE